MKRLVIKIFLIILIPCVLFSLLMLSVNDDYSQHSHEKNVALAYERLDSLQNINKIVIIAGSNGAFGINSKILADSLDLPVVNTSTHASIGVRMQFEMYKDFLKEGDIVVFCPEYYSGKDRLYGGAQLFSILTTHLPCAYSKISLPQWVYLIKYIGVHYRVAMGDHRNCPAFEGEYSAQSINQYGDIDYPRQHQPNLSPYHLKGSMDRSTVKYYQYIHSYAKERGLHLIYLPPTMCESGYLYQKSQLDSLELFMTEHGIPYFASPKQYSFSDTLYFDTPYHMTQQGATVRTFKLLDDIKRYMSLNH